MTKEEKIIGLLIVGAMIVLMLWTVYSDCGSFNCRYEGDVPSLEMQKILSETY